MSQYNYSCIHECGDEDCGKCMVHGIIPYCPADCTDYVDKVNWGGVMEQKKCCGNCKYHHPDDTFPADWICVNDESEYCGDYTEYEDHCDGYEEREKA